MSKILTQSFRVNSCIFCLTVGTCRARVITKVAIKSCGRSHILMIHYNIVHETVSIVDSFLQDIGAISWKTPVNNISKKIKRSMGILSKLRYFLSIKTLLSLYYALVEPFLNNCTIATSIYITEESLKNNYFL